MAKQRMLEIFLSYGVKFPTAAKLERFVRYGSTDKVYISNSS
jgi:hypothetical protein